MQNVPKIVRERLQAATPASHHPDADVLAAFAERSLPERERANVLAHLARCADCRDVLALALPASEEMQPVVVADRRRWLTWPAVRWGFAAAAGVAIVSLGILQYQRHLHPEMTAGSQTPRPEAVATYVHSEPAVPSASPAPPEKQETRLAAAPSSPQVTSSGKAGAAQPSGQKMIARAKVPPAAVGAGAGVGAGVSRSPSSHGPEMPAQWQQQAARGQASPAGTLQAGAQAHAVGGPLKMKVPSAPEAAEVQGQAVQFDTQARNEQLLKDRASAPLRPDESPPATFVRAKPVVNSQATNSAAPVPTVAMPAQSELEGNLAATASAPRWTITPAGGLQRSFDQGKTWQDVDVNAGLPLPAIKSTDAFAETARVKEYQADKKTLKAVPAVLFRAVTAIGTEVWAGGSGGALYHSLDAGVHWTRVVPSSGGAVPTGDILGLEFPGSGQGRIATSTGEVWTTNDNGQVWQKQ